MLPPDYNMNDKKTQEWHAISLTLPKEGSDWISHLLFEFGSVGNIEEETPDPALIGMKGYFPVDLGPSSAIIQSILALLEERGIRPLSTYATTIKIQNWAESARQMFTPINILEDITIVNPWSEYECKPDEQAVVINPGMAFGTGYHATTKLAARLMSEAIQTNTIESLLDVGCGSAILSIIAACRDIKTIDAVEIDHDALISARENVTKNQCGETITILDNINKTKSKYDMVVANILYATIVELKTELTKRVKPGGFLVLSRITTEEDEKLLGAFNTSGIEFIKKDEDDGWMGYLFRCS